MKSKKKRAIVENVTEVVLACILLGVFAVSFATVWSLNPVPATGTEDKTVLGVSVSSKPFEMLQDDTFEQTNYIGSDNSFSADYTLAVSEESPEREYSIVKLSNATNSQRNIAVKVTISKDQIKWFKVSGKVNDTEYPIYDALTSDDVYDLVVKLPANSESIFKLDLTSYSESAPAELKATINMQILSD